MGLGSFVASHRRNYPVRKIAGLCRRYLNWYGNLNYDLESNGEAFVLRTLQRFQPKVIFDAGANIGDWTRLAAGACPGARLYSFEISGPTYRTLAAQTAGLPQVQCVNKGLSDCSGVITIRHYDDMPVLTTATSYPHGLPYHEVQAEVVSGDEFARAAGIEHIDLLKIDVEGMEEQVLRGFSELLSAQSIDLIQFEYGRVSIVNGFLLRHFHEFFAQRGYAVGKIYPNYVDFREYDLADEDFVGPNFLACRKSMGSHLAAFSGHATP